MWVFFFLHRYLDNVVNRQSVSPPIPHLHALLTSGDDPPLEIDIFDLIRTSYEVRFWLSFYPTGFSLLIIPHYADGT